MTTHLREELAALADTQSFSPDPSAWDRGRRVRRRDRVVRTAVVVAVVGLVAGVGALAVRPDREARTASTEEVQRGAIPSRIVDPDGLTATADLAVGRASVAFVGASSDVVVVDAEDGSYRALELPESPRPGPVQLSPDGTRLAYPYQAESRVVEGGVEAGIAILDLRSGDVRRVPAASFSGLAVAVSSIGWSADSAYVAWSGQGVLAWTDGRIEPERGGGTLGVVAIDTGEQSTIASSPGAVSVDGDGFATLVTEKHVTSFASLSSGAIRSPLRVELPGTGAGDRATTSPSGELTAIGSTTGSPALFVTGEGDVVGRALDTALYPRGAQVAPLGWAADSLVLAEVDRPDSGYVEGRHLALFTSPDRPKSEWTYRILVRDLPDVQDLSVAVDLVPDLDGTSSQQLTHDFGDVLAPDAGGMSWLLGLGVAAAIAVLVGLRRLFGVFRRRRLGL